jgi:hypothetical protein
MTRNLDARLAELEAHNRRRTRAGQTELLTPEVMAAGLRLLSDADLEILAAGPAAAGWQGANDRLYSAVYGEQP